MNRRNEMTLPNSLSSTISSMKLALLANHSEVIPPLAAWYFAEWGYEVPGNTLEKEAQNLRQYLNEDQIPLIVVAMADIRLVGAAQLKYREMDIYPDKEHWLGAVFVDPAFRGKRIARRIIEEVISLARKFGVAELHLQTEEMDGGLYAAMGWEPIERVSYHGVEVLVMCKRLDEPNQ